ncbi:MAG TPA: DUF2304 family protein [Candidatus Udaeobacter sp.]|nr:DUF2304 family protein [Candidatus Udaeobacter sp.]
MIVTQILLVVFFLFALIKVISRFRDGDLSKLGLILWSLFWLAAAGVVLLPNSTAYLAKLAGIGRGADLVVYVSLAAIFFIIFRLLIKIELLNKDITKLTRKIALQDKNKNLDK